jgi:hypothetical protein
MKLDDKVWYLACNDTMAVLKEYFACYKLRLIPIFSIHSVVVAGKQKIPDSYILHGGIQARYADVVRVMIKG